MNWRYNGNEIKSIKDIPNKAIGFVYLIEIGEGVNKRYYIGKKHLYSERNKEIAESTWRKLKEEGVEGLHRTKNKKLSKKGAPVWRYKIHERKESNWRSYNSSNSDVQKTIKKGINYYKTILAFAFNKKELSYLEEKMLYSHEVLEKGDKFFNDNIAGRYFTNDIVKN